MVRSYSIRGVGRTGTGGTGANDSPGFNVPSRRATELDHGQGGGLHFPARQEHPAFYVLETCTGFLFLHVHDTCRSINTESRSAVVHCVWTEFGRHYRYIVNKGTGDMKGMVVSSLLTSVFAAKKRVH